MTHPQITDDETALIEQAQRGDRNAFGELVSRYYTGVVRVVYRLCGDTGLVAATAALEHAGLRQRPVAPDRIGAFIATGTHGHNAEGLFAAFAESAIGDAEAPRQHLVPKLHEIITDAPLFGCQWRELLGPFVRLHGD